MAPSQKAEKYNLSVRTFIKNLDLAGFGSGAVSI
jgi:hypothetical protein